MTDNKPTPRVRGLGATLRDVRKERKVTLRELGARLNRDFTMISRWENGEKTPSLMQVAEILHGLGITGEQYDEILSLAHRTEDPLWAVTGLPGQQQQLNTVLEYELTAARITSVTHQLIPGMLQTSDYTRAVMRRAKVPNIESETRVAVRIGRREALTRRNPAHLTAIIGEAALRARIGGPEVMLDQLRHLLKMSELLTVDLFVVPADTDWHPGMDGTFDMIECLDGTIVVHMENRRSGIFLHQEDDVQVYLDAIPEILAVALKSKDSIDRINLEIAELEKNG